MALGMRVELFDFDLPEERIALRPASPRGAAHMLVVRPGEEPPLDDRTVRDLPDLLRPGDVLVVNDTRVIPARLWGLRTRGEAAARVEILLHKREGAERWHAFARPAKRLAVGDRIRFGEDSESTACLLASLDAEVEARGEGGEVTVRYAFAGLDAMQAAYAHAISHNYRFYSYGDACLLFPSFRGDRRSSPEPTTGRDGLR